MGILVSDFDGTMTRVDFFEVVRRRWPAPVSHDPWNRYVSGESTHFEALAEIFASVRTTPAGMDEIMDAMAVDPRLADGVARLRASGWETIVASAGCAWYIERILDRAGVRLAVEANPGTFEPTQGLIMEPPRDSPHFSAVTGIDKSSVVRAALRRSDHVAFAGDGPPDLEPALLVLSGHRFARGWLAAALDERGESYRSFDAWSDVVDQILANPC